VVIFALLDPDPDSDSGSATLLSQVAEDWRLCEESVRKEYEEKAQRYNAEEEKRWRQKLYLHQQQQMHLQAS
jgi:hypothetical protein